MPFRMSSDSSTLMPLYATPRWSRICTTWPEKPHIGNCGVPFMNSTTSFAFTSLSMNCSIPMEFRPVGRGAPVMSIYVPKKLLPTQERRPDLPGFRGKKCALDLENVVLVQPADLDDRAWRIRTTSPQRLLDLVHQRPQPAHVGHEDRKTNAVGKACAFRPGDQFHVHERLADARLVTLHELVIRRIDAAHSGNEYKIARADAETPGTGWLDRAFGRKHRDAARHGVPVCRASACSTPPIWPLSASYTS